MLGSCVTTLGKFFVEGLEVLATSGLVYSKYPHTQPLFSQTQKEAGYEAWCNGKISSGFGVTTVANYILYKA